METKDNGKYGTRDPSVPAVGPSAPAATTASFEPSKLADEDRSVRSEPAPQMRFATRGERKDPDEMSKTKLVLLAGGLLVAVLFFVFTAVAGKAPKKSTGHIQSSNRSKAMSASTQQPNSSVIPIMNTVGTRNLNNLGEEVTPDEIRRTQSSDDGVGSRRRNTSEQALAKPVAGASLASVPPFSATQQRWEDPQPYEQTTRPAKPQAQSQNALKEPSIVFVRSLAQNRALPPLKAQVVHDDTPLLDLPPGTRIEAELETQISSAVQAPVVVVVEYTYAIGDRIVIPAGARIYGQLVQADRSGFVSVKFDEIELLDGAREKIDAVGTDLSLGPIRGKVYGKNRGKNFLVRTASGLGSVLAEVAGNNTSTVFSEDDLLRERLAENIGTAGDSEVMSLNANSRVVVSVPANTKIYVVFTKHEQSPSQLRAISPAAQ